MSKPLGHQGESAPPSTRERIFKAAIGIFSDRGFHDATMEEIAARAGVAKGTLYYNFPSKTGLFVELIADGMEKFLARLEAEVISDVPFKDHFRRLVRVHLDMLIEHLQLLTIALNPTVYGFEKDTVNVIHKSWKKYLDFLAAQLLRGQQQGHIRAGDPVLMAHEVLGALGGLLRYYTSHAEPVNGQPGMGVSGPMLPGHFAKEWLLEELLLLFSRGILASESDHGGGLDEA